jgi:hypothetical protein
MGNAALSLWIARSKISIDSAYVKLIALKRTKLMLLQITIINDAEKENCND